jgi:hypothetical protein
VCAGFCWLVRRKGCGWTWALVACGICALAAFFARVDIEVHSLMFGFGLAWGWSRAAVPVLVVGAAYARQRRRDCQREGNRRPPVPLLSRREAVPSGGERRRQLFLPDLEVRLALRARQTRDRR